MHAEQGQRVLFALVRRDLINFSTGRPKEPVTLKDLVPDLDGSVEASSQPRCMTKKRRERVASTLREIFGNMPGVTFLPGE